MQDKKSEFFKLMLLLRETYGDRSYHDNILKIWWDELGHVKISKLKKAINRSMADHPNTNYPPKVSDIEKVLCFIREDEIKIEKKESQENSLSMEEISEYLKSIKI